MRTRCPLIVALLSGALLLVFAGNATAQEPDMELWFQRCEPEMTLSLSMRIERDANRTLAPAVERSLRAVGSPSDVSAGPPPASPALPVETIERRPVAPSTSTSCVARGASSLACVVRAID